MQCSECGNENLPGELECSLCNHPLPEEIVLGQPASEDPTERLDVAALRAKLKPPSRAKPATAAKPAKPGTPAKPPRAWLHCEPLEPIALIDGQDTKIGRERTCELVLPHSSVSRHHATIKVKGADLVLEDRGSVNGTLLNGKRAPKSSTVRIGDSIQIGPYQIELWAVRDLPDAGATQTVPVPSAASGSKYTAYEAKLGETSMRDLLRDLEAKKRTGTLSVADGQRRGQIVFFDGRPIMASWAGQTADDAVRAIAELTVGAIAFSTQVDAGEVDFEEPEEMLSITEVLAPPKAPPPD